MIGSLTHSRPSNVFKTPFDSSRRKHAWPDFVLLDHNKKLYLPDLQLMEKLGVVSAGGSLFSCVSLSAVAD